MEIDATTECGQMVERRLRADRIVWLTTVDGQGVPQPRPVWYFWDGAHFIIYSRANQYKERHIMARQDVAVNFDSDGTGGDIIVFIGKAEIARDLPPADQVAGYAQKYSPVLQRMSIQEFAMEFPVPIRVTPHRLRGH